ncbi:MAG: CZB domain-containing protein [Nitrospirae bacterium]|nr:CZB domain-containing protein [Nitrospirota bacterium]
MKAKGFSKALLYHLQWKVQLRKFLEGKCDFDVTGVSSEDCKFGKWLRSEEVAKYASHPEIREIEKAHIRLHQSAKRVYGLKMLGEDLAAQRELKKVEANSMKLASLLSTLRIVNEN